MMMIARSVHTHRAAIGLRIVSSLRLPLLLLVVLALVFGASAFAQTAHYSGAQNTIYGPANAPYGVAVDRSGNVFFTINSGVYEIVAVNGVASSTSTVIPLAKGAFAEPIGVAVDGNGNVFVADRVNNSVYEILASNGTVQSLGNYNFANPSGVAVDASGNVFFVDQSGVYEIVAVGGVVSSTSTVIQLGSGNFGWNPQGIAVDASGNVFVADTWNSAVKEILASGGSIPATPTIVTLGSGFYNPYAVTVDGSGNVFVADTWNNEVKEILASEGSIPATPTILTLGSGFSYPDGVAVDGSGNVFVADQANGRVVKLEGGAANCGAVRVGTEVMKNIKQGSTNSSQVSLLFTFDTPGSIGSPVVLSQGAPGPDFTDAHSGSCTTNGPIHTYNPGDTCAVNVTFRPGFPGTRRGAVILQDLSGNTIATGNVTGTGIGPQVNFFQPNSTPTPLLSSGLARPRGVALDGAGNIFVADTDNGMVKEFLAANGYSTFLTLGNGNANIQAPRGIALDGSGNLFVADAGFMTGSVYEIPSGCTSSGCVVVLGGGFTNPYGVAVDESGTVFVADFGSGSVQEIPSGCFSNLCVQTPWVGSSNPWGAALDSNGNLFVSFHGDNTVREFLAASGYADSWQIAAANGNFNGPSGLFIDGNDNLFVGDANNEEVKEFLATSGYTTFINNLGSGYHYPEAVAVDGSGNVFVADSWNNQVVELDYADAPSLNFLTATLAGTTDSTDAAPVVTVENIGNAPLTFSVGYPADFTDTGISDCSVSVSLEAGTSCPLTISFTPTITAAGPLSETISLTDNTLNALAATQSITVSGFATASAPSQTIPTIHWAPPSAINFGSDLTSILNAAAVDGGNNTIAGTFSYTATPAGGSAVPVNSATILAPGSYTLVASFVPLNPSSCTSATTSVPLTVSQSFVAGTVGTPSPTPMTVTFTIPSATTLTSVSVVTQGAQGADFTDALTGTCTTNGSGYQYSQGDTCTVNVTFTPTAIGVRKGAVILNSSSWNWMNEPSTLITGSGVGAAIAFGPGAVSTVAGNGTAGHSGDGNAATAAQLNLPGGLVLDGSGNLYISEYGSSTVRMVTPQGVINTVAGTGTAGYNGDGPAATAQLSKPSGLAMDGVGNLYIANYGDGSVRVLDPATQQIATIYPAGILDHLTGFAVDGLGGFYLALAWENSVIDNDMMVGTGTQGYSGDGGPASQAELNFPTGLAVDGAGNLYIADSMNKVVRMVNPSGMISTVAGNANSQSAPCSGDGGLAVNADLQRPGGVTVDAGGNLYIADYLCGSIRKVSPAGFITTVAGDGNLTYGGDGGPATSAQLNLPAGVVADSKGNLYIADSANSRVRKVDVSDAPTLSFPTPTIEASTDSTDGAQVVTVENIGNAALTFSALSYPADFIDIGTSDCSVSASLAAGTSCLLTIGFTPTTAGLLSETISLTDNSLNPTSTQSIMVSGTGSKVTPAITTLPTAAAITYGQTLASSTLSGGVASVAGGFAFTTLAAQPGAGTGMQSVTFTPSDSVDYNPVTASVSVTVSQALASVTPGVTSKIYGTTDPAFVGTLTGFVAGDGVSATYSRAAGETVAGGPYVISATLSPSGALANYNVTYNTANFTINKAALTATANNASMSFDASLPSLSGALTGVVSGDGITANFTTVATSNSAAGAYPITPQLSDPSSKLSNYNVVLTNGTLTVGTDTTSVTVQSSAGMAMTESNVTFTAKVLGSVGTPAGSVSFLDGSTALGTATLDNSGTATLTVSTLSVGSHNITAVYAGNVDYLGSTSTAITETVQDFNFSINGSTPTVVAATVQPGNSGVYTLQVAPTNGTTFASAVTLTLTGLPAGATYTITPPTISVGSSAATITVTVNTAKTSALSGSPSGIPFPKPLLLAIFLPLFGTRKFRRAMRMQRIPMMLMLVTLGILMATGMSGCSSGTSLPAAQTTPMTLTATSGAVHHTVTLNLTIQ